jgi:hypothetical protein
MQPDDLPDRDLGLNHELPDPGSESQGWFSDVEYLATRLDALASATEREFVLSLHDNDSELGEDVFWITGQGLDMSRLRAVLGVDPPRQANWQAAASDERRRTGPRG